MSKYRGAAMTNTEGMPRMYHNPKSTVQVEFTDKDIVGLGLVKLRFTLLSENALTVQVSAVSASGRLRNLTLDKEFVTEYHIDEGNGVVVTQTPERHDEWFNEWEDALLHPSSIPSGSESGKPSGLA